MDEEGIACLRKNLEAQKQEHVLAGLSIGDASQRESLLQQLSSIDLAVFQRGVSDAVRTLDNNSQVDNEPMPPSSYPRANWEDFQHWTSGSDESGQSGDWWSAGLQLIADGQVAVLVLAGGQGTRLGPCAPAVKGMLELNLPEPRSLFQLQAGRLLLIQKIATLWKPHMAAMSWVNLKVTGTSKKIQIPWIVMTSDATDLATRIYFEEKAYFGLEKSQVWFLKQSSLPCIDLNEGHAMLMETPWKIAMAPAGNGSLFADLNDAGVIDKLSHQGVKYIQVYAVDNALARVADPVFYGFVDDHQADVGVKVVSKKHPSEAVGVLCLHTEGAQAERECYGVIEYSELPEHLRTAKDDSEQLLFRAAHICINMFSVDFLRKLGDSKCQLEFHPAVKRIPHVQNHSGSWVSVVPDKPNGIKLERFIFDSFRYCDSEKVVLLEVKREEEFAPIKNAVGPGVADSAATACDLLLALHQQVCSLPTLEKTTKELLLLKAYVGGVP